MSGDAVLVVFLLALLGVPAAAAVWLFWDWMTNRSWHDSYCLCSGCREDAIKREVERRQHYKQRDEIRRAVDEVERG